jgi:hypothetical protein
VLTADKTLSRIVAVDLADQTDRTMHLCLAFAAYVRASGDGAFASRWYIFVQRLLNHYVSPGAKLAANGAVPYFNATLNLLFNPNLEHSRCGVYWSTYDVLTNAFAAEALRGMAAIAAAEGDARQAAAWERTRAALLAGLSSALSYASANETHGASIFAELVGEPHSWWPGSANAWPPGNRTFQAPPAAIWGLSFVNTAVAGAFFRVLGGSRDAPAAAGLDIQRLAATRDTYRRLGSFLWTTDDVRFSALVSSTHVNASVYAAEDRAVIVKALGWELAWAAYSNDILRVLTLGRWLGFAASGNLSLPAESYFYDCMRLHQENCYGDPGNGEQTGWFVWGAALARRAVGL